MITRPVGLSAEIHEALRRIGAEPLDIPMIEIVPLTTFAPFDAAVDKMRPGDWIFLTSQNAAAPVSLRFGGRRPKLLWEEGVSVAAVGPATERKARSVGLPVDFVPSVHNGVAIANELGDRLRGRYVFLPRSDKASSDLPDAIRLHGGEPLEVVAYVTELSSRDSLLQKISAASVDAITVFSPTEIHVLKLTVEEQGMSELQSRIPIVAIGEVTAQACRQCGIQSPLVAADTTAAAVIDVLTAHFASDPSESSGALK